MGETQVYLNVLGKRLDGFFIILKIFVHFYKLILIIFSLIGIFLVCES